MISDPIYLLFQCLDPYLIGSVDPDPEWKTGSGSRQAKITPTTKEKSKDVSMFSLASSVA